MNKSKTKRKTWSDKFPLAAADAISGHLRFPERESYGKPNKTGS